jgi:hypothetical protein
MNKNQTKTSEPYFFIGLVLKGTEKQYLNLLNFMEKSNEAQVIYQCKSLTCLHVTRDDGVKVNVVAPEFMVETASKIGEA